MLLKPIFLDSTAIFWSNMTLPNILWVKLGRSEFWHAFGREQYVVAENVSYLLTLEALWIDELKSALNTKDEFRSKVLTIKL